ncbi:MAG TPA: cupredoxin domain-containing protein [Acidimicrobiales bacterium]|nr:cupredoxin domain-containing protein [Acidimicrobiales bacterium]
MEHRRARRAIPVALVLALVLTLAACGSDGSDAGGNAARTIEITMADNTYAPGDVTVPAGEEVTFTFTNDGTVDHEALIGSAADQAAHEEEMEGGEMDGMDHGDMGAASEAVTVAPGATRSMSMTFDDPGTYLIGCHVPGHYAAGMKATITVT